MNTGEIGRKTKVIWGVNTVAPLFKEKYETYKTNFNNCSGASAAVQLNKSDMARIIYANERVNREQIAKNVARYSIRAGMVIGFVTAVWLIAVVALAVLMFSE